ncbi:hypothetical protein TeGR_g721 [Tetraparma gracilis]|uniref:Rhodanese domain-containing protein n=1 Tax=Tetraparma gracilis TaxID=2962635 RepID=A0ABQ6NA58_9STRA|nr:hypothetical protein TeGR_g721 [Tetraparma gracilis]
MAGFSLQRGTSASRGPIFLLKFQGRSLAIPDTLPVGLLLGSLLLLPPLLLSLRSSSSLRSRFASLSASAASSRSQLSEAAELSARLRKDALAAGAAAERRLLKSLLPTLDALALAGGAEGSRADLKRGVELTGDGLRAALEKHGLREVAAEPGMRMDPAVHEAVMMRAGGRSMEIAEVLRGGYVQGEGGEGKVVRAAQVAVFDGRGEEKGGGPASPPEHKRKKGVSSPEELRAFVAAAGADLVVVDARNPDFEREPGDAESSEKAPLAGASKGYRPGAYNLPYDRANERMDLGLLPERCGLDTPIISHCGGGGRGRKARDFLRASGYTNVLNGGGPEDAECWREFGDK